MGHMCIDIYIYIIYGCFSLVLNEGKYDEVPAQMKRWNKAKGKVLAGLTRRREAEALMFEGKSWEHI